ncbi:MAG: LCP family protein [Prochlorococcaceae cyanobacterium]
MPERVHHSQASTPLPATPRLVRLRRWGWILLGILAGTTMVDRLWPNPDPAVAPEEPLSARSLAAPVARPITLLLIGSDADRIGAASNGAAPLGPANSDALLLLRVAAKTPPQLLALPTELAVQLPGRGTPQALGSLYREGGVALAAEAIQELLDLERGQPDRYLVISRGALRQLIDGLGTIEANPDRTMSYHDKRLNYRIQIQGGLQQFNGNQVEQLLRYRDESGPVALAGPGRRQRQQQLASSLLLQMGRPEQLAQLPPLLAQLKAEVDTNLSQGEALSLLATLLSDPQTLRFSQLPLAAAKDRQQPLRQLAAGAPKPLWPKLEPQPRP